VVETRALLAALVQQGEPTLVEQQVRRPPAERLPPVVDALALAAQAERLSSPAEPAAAEPELEVWAAER
jgi:hypothetical protein